MPENQSSLFIFLKAFKGLERSSMAILSSTHLNTPVSNSLVFFALPQRENLPPLCFSIVFSDYLGWFSIVK